MKNSHSAISNQLQWVKNIKYLRQKLKVEKEFWIVGIFFSLFVSKHISHCTWKLQAYHLNIVWITYSFKQSAFKFTNNWWSRHLCNLFLFLFPWAFLSVKFLYLYINIQYFLQYLLFFLCFWTLKFFYCSTTTQLLFFY